MNTKLSIFGTLLTAALAWTTAPQAGASVLYKNPSSGNLGNRFLVTAGPDSVSSWLPGAAGNQVIMSGPAGKTISQLTKFSFDYWSTGPVTAQLFFYANDGAEYNVPGGSGGPLQPMTVLYDSGPVVLGATPSGGTEFKSLEFGTGDWGIGGLFVPAKEFTWAVTFTGMTLDNEAGLSLASVPGPGANRHPYSYWRQKFPYTTWETRQSVNPPDSFMEFAAMFEGEMVPEPSPVLYGAVLCGGIGLWFVRRRMQRPALAK